MRRDVVPAGGNPVRARACTSRPLIAKPPAPVGSPSRSTPGRRWRRPSPVPPVLLPSGKRGSTGPDRTPQAARRAAGRWRSPGSPLRPMVPAGSPFTARAVAGAAGCTMSPSSPPCPRSPRSMSATSLPVGRAVGSPRRCAGTSSPPRSPSTSLPARSDPTSRPGRRCSGGAGRSRRDRRGSRRVARTAAGARARRLDGCRRADPCPIQDGLSMVSAGLVAAGPCGVARAVSGRARLVGGAGRRGPGHRSPPDPEWASHPPRRRRCALA